MARCRQVTNKELIDEARNWLGVPFKHQGRTRYGVDCVGFVEVLAKTCGLLPPDYDEPHDYGRRAGNGVIAALERHTAGRTKRIVPGVLVAIAWPREPYASHVALCTGPTLIHAYARAGKVVEHGYRAPWPKLTHSFWKLANVTYE